MTEIRRLQHIDEQREGLEASESLDESFIEDIFLNEEHVKGGEVKGGEVKGGEVLGAECASACQNTQQVTCPKCPGEGCYCDGGFFDCAENFYENIGRHKECEDEFETCGNSDAGGGVDEPDETRYVNSDDRFRNYR